MAIEYLDEQTNSSNSKFEYMDEPTISQGQPQNLLSQLIGIAQNKDMSLPEKIREVESNLFPQSPNEQKAKAANMYGISKTTGIPIEQLNKDNSKLFNQLVQNPQVTGIQRDQPTKEQYNTMFFTPGILAAGAVNPIGTGLALGGYSLLNKLLPPEKFISSDMNETAKGTFEIADMLAKGGIVAEGMGPTTKALRYAMTKMGKVPLAQAIRFMTGTVPQAHAERVIENPDILSPAILEKEGKEASQAYQDIIKPLRKDTEAQVDLTPVKDVIDQEGLKIGPMQYSSEMHKMSQKEAQKIIDWTNWIDYQVRGNAKPTYNDVEGKIYEIDEALGKFYKKAEHGQLTGKEPINEPFERIASILRSNLSQTLKTQFPRVAPIIERYHNYILDRQAADSFKGINASFFKAMPIKMTLLALGAGTKGALLPAYLSTMPAFWKKLIQTSDIIGKKTELFPEQIKNTFRGKSASVVPPVIKPYVSHDELSSPE